MQRGAHGLTLRATKARRERGYAPDGRNNHYLVSQLNVFRGGLTRLGRTVKGHGLSLVKGPVTGVKTMGPDVDLDRNGGPYDEADGGEAMRGLADLDAKDRERVRLT